MGVGGGGGWGTYCQAACALLYSATDAHAQTLHSDVAHGGQRHYTTDGEGSATKGARLGAQCAKDENQDWRRLNIGRTMDGVATSVESG